MPNSPRRIQNHRAFTLVELLVVVAVIGGLIALLLPAVQSARESARRATCKNHLRQIATAWHVHMDAQGHFPTGGWPGFTGDPERGFHKKQPGEWTYNILPYIEQQALHELGANDGVAAYLDAAAYVQRTETPLDIYNCPSRRQQQAMPLPDAWIEVLNEEPSNNVRPLPLDGRNVLRSLFYVDYAANEGAAHPGGGLEPGGTPRSYVEGDLAHFNWLNNYFGGGICFTRSEIRTSDLEDGLGNTYLVGEKRVAPKHYGGPNPQGNIWDVDHDDFGEPYRARLSGVQVTRRFVGVQNFGVIEPSSHVPTPDTIDVSGPEGRFGSAHDSSFHMAFCDASVRAISYDIDPNLHVRLGLRDDGLPADPDMSGPFLPVRRE